MRITHQERCFTEVMTEVRGSERSGLDTGGAADGRSDAPMDMAMEMVTAVTSIAAETAGEDTLEPMERNENESGEGGVMFRQPPGPSGTGGPAWSTRLSSKPAK